MGPGRVARVGDTATAPFDLPGLQRVSYLLSCSSKSHKIPPIMHQNSPFSDQKTNIKKFCGGGTRPRIAGKTRLLSWTTLSTAYSHRPGVDARRTSMYSANQRRPFCDWKRRHCPCRTPAAVETIRQNRQHFRLTSTSILTTTVDGKCLTVCMNKL